MLGSSWSSWPSRVRPWQTLDGACVESVESGSLKMPVFVRAWLPLPDRGQWHPVRVECHMEKLWQISPGTAVKWGASLLSPSGEQWPEGIHAYAGWLASFVPFLSGSF